MSFTLPPLPYSQDALEPYISSRTIDFHYKKHHAGYLNNLNNLIEGTDLEHEDLETIIKKTAADKSNKGIFNNAAQFWNHNFYWKSMKNRGGKPSEYVLDLINKSFGNFEKFQEEFKTAATTQFGSGWVWLILEYNNLKIIKTSNADTPIIHREKPLLVIDVWEHAYYLDYQNRRADYIDTFINKLINWNFVVENLG